MQYAKDSLKVYKSFRQKAQAVVADLQAKGITHVHLDGSGSDEIMDILRLTCLEAEISLVLSPGSAVLKHIDQEYQIVYPETEE